MLPFLIGPETTSGWRRDTGQTTGDQEPLASDLETKYCLQQTVEPPPGIINMHCSLTHDDMPNDPLQFGKAQSKNRWERRACNYGFCKAVGIIMHM